MLIIHLKGKLGAGKSFAAGVLLEAYCAQLMERGSGPVVQYSNSRELPYEEAVTLARAGGVGVLIYEEQTRE